MNISRSPVNSDAGPSDVRRGYKCMNCLALARRIHADSLIGASALIAGLKVGLQFFPDHAISRVLRLRTDHAEFRHPCFERCRLESEPLGGATGPADPPVRALERCANVLDLHVLERQ